MEKLECIARIKTILEETDLLPFNREVQDLKAHFTNLKLEEEKNRESLVDEDESEQGQTEDGSYENVTDLDADQKEESKEEAPDELYLEFEQLLAAFKEKYNEQREAKNNIEKANLDQKKALINQLRGLIQNEENIGQAFSTQKEIQEKWREIGDIPRDERQEIQNDYSRLMEQFYYNIGIYKELREHDLKRNQQLKEEIIEKLKPLAQVSSIQEIEGELKNLQHEWEEIGGTFQEVWEELKAQYWSIVKSLYDKIRNHYEARRAEQNKNLEAKKEVLEKAKTLVAECLEKNEHNVFNDGTKTLLELQEQWKGIGFGPRKENEEVWVEFRSVCDQFFKGKQAFYNERNKGFDAVVQQKVALIAQVNEVKESTDWKNTTNKIINLQKDWKKLGHAGPKNEQKLWKQFRSACDAFFNKKEAHFAELDAANGENLAAKEALIEEIKGYQLKEDKKDSLNDLREFSKRFSEIGNVPFKQKDTIYASFKGAMDAHYQSLDLKGAEKEKVLFKAHLETLEASPNSERLYDVERRKLYQQIQRAEQEIRQYENNLGFFSKSTKNNPLLKTVEKNIEAAKKTIEDCRNKLKLIPNE